MAVGVGNDRLSIIGSRKATNMGQELAGTETLSKNLSVIREFQALGTNESLRGTYLLIPDVC